MAFAANDRSHGHTLNPLWERSVAAKAALRYI
jgi:hypothetical protein